MDFSAHVKKIGDENYQRTDKNERMRLVNFSRYPLYIIMSVYRQCNAKGFLISRNNILHALRSRQAVDM